MRLLSLFSNLRFSWIIQNVNVFLLSAPEPEDFSTWFWSAESTAGWAGRSAREDSSVARTLIPYQQPPDSVTVG